MKDRTFQEIVNRIAEIEWILETTGADPDDREVKSLRAEIAEIVQVLDRIRGTESVTYQQFRTALDAGAPCEILVELKANMDRSKDPLYQDAANDLKAIGCYMKSSKRRDQG